MQIKLIEDSVINGNQFKVYRLTNANNMVVEICNYGARIARIQYTDINSNQTDILCGYSDAKEFIDKPNPYFNAVIGRVCNRIANSKFSLNGKDYELYANNGKNSLHGGKEGFDKKYWDIAVDNGRIRLDYISPDGEEGYPGELRVSVYYFLNEDDELEIEYRYMSNKDTIANFTNHAYFNLNGNFSHKVLNHFLKIDADNISAVNNELIPHSLRAVENTPFDFREYKQIGRDINSQDEQIKIANGYDHNFVFNNHNYEQCVCEVFSPITQIEMRVYTDAPCMQLYTGNGLNDYGREHYSEYSAFCLETQNFPNLINEVDNEKAIVKAGHEYSTRTKYSFRLRNISDNDIDGKVLVEELIEYSKNNLQLSDFDETFIRNILLTQFRLNEPYIKRINKKYISGLTVPDVLMNSIEGYSIRKGLTDIYSVSRFSNYIMGIITPLPSKINETFYKLKSTTGVKSATDYFYNLCIKNNYIQKTAIDKNLKWDFTSNGKKLEITINLSKPEKNNKDIARLIQVKQPAIYPQCPLCKENEGFYGSDKIQPRTNIRTITLNLNGEEWFMQYSPYAYFDEHCICINKEHTPMDIYPGTINKLLDFVDLFPEYFIGSNASLPYIGGSILNHEHFQGGKHKLPMFYSELKVEIEQTKYPHTRVGILDWFNSAILLSGTDKDEIIRLGGEIITKWKNYENKELNIINKSDGIIHNSLSPIARINENGEYNLYFILRNNIQTDEFPEGYFHAHPEYHNIKKEGIGLIEAMGLFILPARLKKQLSLISGILCKEIEYNPQEISDTDNYLYVHRDMIDYLVNNFSPENYTQAKEIVINRVNEVCENILENTCVFKQNALNEFKDFIQICLK